MNNIVLLYKLTWDAAYQYVHDFIHILKEKLHISQEKKYWNFV